MTKSISERVLEITAREGQFNRVIARRSFRNYPGRQLHNSIMRRARELSERGLLRGNDGNFTLTARGKQAIA